jgi:hypothetical protein
VTEAYALYDSEIGHEILTPIHTVLPTSENLQDQVDPLIDYIHSHRLITTLPSCPTSLGLRLACSRMHIPADKSIRQNSNYTELPVDAYINDFSMTGLMLSRKVVVVVLQRYVIVAINNSNFTAMRDKLRDLTHGIFLSNSIYSSMIPRFRKPAMMEYHRS